MLFLFIREHWTQDGGRRHYTRFEIIYLIRHYALWREISPVTSPGPLSVAPTRNKRIWNSLPKSIRSEPDLLDNWFGFAFRPNTI